MRIRKTCLALAVFSSLVLGTSAASAANQAFAILAGGFEVPAADADGFGTATFLFVSNRMICFAVLVDNIATPTVMHVHKAPPGVGGPPVITLTPPNAGDPGRVSGCIGGLDPILVKDIRNNPTSYYINVHTGDFSGGAIRGQLF